SDGLPPQEAQAGLPPTPELLALLQRAETDLMDGDQVNGGPVNEALARSRGLIEAELVEYLGPMARVVVEEHLATASGLTDLIESLAGELNDPAKSVRFKERVRERLRSTGQS